MWFLMRVHTYSLTYGQSIMFLWWHLVPTSPWGKFHPVSTAILIVTMISIRPHSGHISVSLISAYHHRDLFSRDGCQEERGFHISKERGISRRGGMNKERGRGLIHLSTLWYNCLNSFYNNLYYKFRIMYLTSSFPIHHFSTPWKHQKTVRFSGVRERVHWEQMG